MTAKQYMSAKAYLHSHYAEIFHQQPTDVRLFQFACYIEMAQAPDGNGGVA